MTWFATLSLGVVLLLASAGWLAAGGAGQETLATGVRLEKNVPGRMRDGVLLRADVYRPSGDRSWPALLQRTPYSKNDRDAARRFSAIAARGYVVVVQDTRGRYTSDGVAVPHDEADDGYDSVQWAAALPGVNGKVGMFGGSYLATTQLEAATRRPPALVALFPASSYSRRHDMVFQGGAFYLSDGLGWNLGQAMDVRRRVLTPAVDRDGPIGLSSGPVGATPVHMAVAPAAEVVQRVRPGTLCARLPPDAVAPRRRRVLGAGRHREPARSLRGAGLPPHRLVRHAADRHPAQLHGTARARRQRDRAALPAAGGGPLDPRAPDPRVHEDRRGRLRRRRWLRVRRSDDRLVRPLVEGRRPRRRWIQRPSACS